MENLNNRLIDPDFHFSSERRPQNTDYNWQAIVNGWSLIEREIVSENDLDKKHIKSVVVRLGDTQKLMQLVFQREAAWKQDPFYSHRLNLYELDSDLRDRAPSGLIIIWSLENRYHRISTTDVRSLPGYAGNGLGTALFKLADIIITKKIVPLTSLDPQYSQLPIVGLIEDTAHDLNGKISHWTTFQAEPLGYRVTGKNVNGWPVLTKKLA